MRIWETEDKKALPSNLVREQDFILRVRSMKRAEIRCFVANFLISQIEPSHGGRGPLEEAQKRLRIFADANGCSYHEMSNGDVFLACLDMNEAALMPQKAMSVIMPNGMSPDDVERYSVGYRMPEEYGILRERTNYYVEESRTLSSSGAGSSAQILLGDAARGALTAWSLDHIENLLCDIDLRSYLRSQSIFENKNGEWMPLYDEFFIGFDDLKKAHFPKLEILPHEHLFLELCQALDGRLLLELTNRPEIVAGRSISLNLSILSVMGTIFAQFAHNIPKAEHKKVNFEINKGDMFQDLCQTTDAMSTLKAEGFKVAVDDVTPDMLCYADFSRFKTDYIKVNMSKLNVGQIDEPATREAVLRVPREKLIFYRCDNERALNFGLENGVTKFQGWLIDDMSGSAN